MSQPVATTAVPSQNVIQPTQTTGTAEIAAVGSAFTTGSLSALVPWQQTYVRKVPSSRTDSFYIATFLLSEIGGLTEQLRGSLIQEVEDVTINVRKITSTDVTYFGFVAAEDDFENVLDSDADSLAAFLRSYPTARPVHTLTSDTTKSDVTIPLIWGLGLSRYVGNPIPPALRPIVILYVEGGASFAGRTIQFTISGNVRLTGIGHVARRVARAAPATS